MPARQRRTEHALLEDLVRLHQVRWEVWPVQAVVSGQLRSVGFNLELYGVHDHPRHAPAPGCDECAAVYRDLRRIARWILPPDDRESDYALQQFDGSLHYTELARPEVRVTVQIRHRRGVELPVDACELRCVADMEAALQRLGAHKHLPADASR